MLNIWFWGTPIVWAAEGVVPAQYQWLIHANPIEYVIEGYRGSLLYQQPLWANAMQGLYVWGVALVMLLCGASVFRRLKPQFGDVL